MREDSLICSSILTDLYDMHKDAFKIWSGLEILFEIYKSSGVVSISQSMPDLREEQNERSTEVGVDNDWEKRTDYYRYRKGMRYSGFCGD